jgi:type II secretory pathway predicted ATPase ExeA
MYERFFGFDRRPFASAPDADCYFPGTAIEAARLTLFRCLERGEGAGVLIGPAGTGKSLLLQVLAEQFTGRATTAMLSSGRLSTRRALLQAILFELDLPYRERDESELRLSLVDHMTTLAAPLIGLVLLVDEAHTLPLRLLEELRLITNVVRNGQPMVRLVLAGGMSLEERLTSPRLEAFHQRVTARCYLQPFDRAETAEFIRAAFVWAGGQPERIFTHDAYEAVHRATDGIPRLVNQVCDHALVLAREAQVYKLDKRRIEEAWADLQQLPTTWSEPGRAQKSGAAEVIEFGALDEGSDDATDADSTQTTNIDIEFDAMNDERSSDPPAAVPFPLAHERDEGMTLAAEKMRTFGHDPLERLKRVQQQLASIDRYDDGGTLGTEIDLSFEPQLSANPFSEQFADEEIVLDPYAGIEFDPLYNRPLVESEEGRALGALLKSAPAPRLAVAEELEIGFGGGVELSEEIETTAAGDCAKPPATESRNETGGSPLLSFNAAHAREPQSKPKVAQGEDTVLIGETEMIVIEDESAAPPHISVVPRQQLRQQFANMRRR